MQGARTLYRECVYVARLVLPSKPASVSRP